MAGRAGVGAGGRAEARLLRTELPTLFRIGNGADQSTRIAGMATCIHMAGVTRRFGTRTAVSDFSLDVQTGEIVGLLGPNGAGKSTTLNMLCGLVRPQRGEICLFGKDLRRHFIEIARKTGVVLERPVFYEHLSVRRNLKLQARLARRTVNVDRILGMAGILECAGELAGTLPQEMRQRLALAHAILTEPELLLLDEPTAGLNAESTQEIHQLLRRLVDEAKVTVLFTSHLLHEVQCVCDRVAIMNEGRLAAVEPANHLLSYDTSRLEVIVDHPERALKRLGGQTWLRRAELKSGYLDVWVEEGAAHQLTALLLGSGLQIAGIVPRRRTLKDYLMRVLNQPRPTEREDDAAEGDGQPNG